MSLVIFDLDGTLVDTVPAFTAAWHQVAPDESDAALSTADVERIVANERTYRDIFHRQANAAGSPRDIPVDDVVPRLANAFREIYPTKAKLYPGVYRLLMALEDQASCAVVGSAPTDLLDEMVDYFGLAGYVDRTYSVESQQASVVEVIAGGGRENVASSLEDAVWVSSRTIQLDTARQEGLQTVFASYGYGRSPDWRPDHSLDRLSRLIRLFSRRD